MKGSPILFLIFFLLIAGLVHLFSPDMFTLSQFIAFAVGVLGAWLIFTITETPHASSTTSTSKSRGNKQNVNKDDLTTLYIGNLAYKVPEKAIKAHFEQYGYVDSVRLMKDRRTGKRKGFGFVEVNAQDAQRMIKKLNDTEFSERTLKVRLAKEKGND